MATIMHSPGKRVRSTFRRPLGRCWASSWGGGPTAPNVSCLSPSVWLAIHSGVKGGALVAP
eukprot:6235293-Pyramimonas_sp.AAC.1